MVPRQKAHNGSLDCVISSLPFWLGIFHEGHNRFDPQMAVLDLNNTQPFIKRNNYNLTNLGKIVKHYFLNVGDNLAEVFTKGQCGS